jgi:aminoglycoside phosphotransferase (APT) family kinase protein
MQTEPDVDRASLIQALTRAYDLRIRGLRFLPTGWLAACYVVTCRDDTRYFLKLHPEDRPAAFAASSRAFYLPLTYQLHHQGILPHIPAPIPNRRGDLETGWAPYAIELAQFVEGTLVGHAGMDAAILARLAGIVGTLHRSTPRIDVDEPLVDNFEIRFEADLLRALDEAPQFAAHPRAGMRALSAFLRAEEAGILDDLDRLRALQAVGRRLEKAKVICHTDLHGENLMIDREGHLILVDWEGALIAPPEHDLMFFAGEETFWTVFLPAYEAAFGRAVLDPDVFAFYYLRRGLEDLTDWIVRIRDGHGSPAQDRADLAEMRDCLAGIASISETVRTIARRLESRTEHQGS